MNRPARSRGLIRSTALAAVGVAAALAALGGGPAGCTQEVKQQKVESRYPVIEPDRSLPTLLDGTIYARTQLGNHTPYTVSAYSMVSQLRGTGDSTAPTGVRQYMLKELARRGFGDRLVPVYGQISPSEVLRDPNYAIVIAEADIPPGARKGEFVDVRVGCLPGNETRSLAHGILFETDLKDGGADRNNPGGAVHTLVKAKGPIFVNPAYALDAGANPTGNARASLRTGTVLFNGLVMQDRPVILQLRQPERRVARMIEERVNERFQLLVDRTKGDGGPGLAEARDEGLVSLYVPRAYQGDWEHFVGVVRHLWLENSPEFNAAKAKLLAAEAVKPDAPLENISYAWEGLGKDAMPVVMPLLTHPQPDVAFAAARAAAFIGEPTGAAETALVQMARSPAHPFRLSAVQTLGALPSSSALNHQLRVLLDADEPTVRIEAYKVLARNNDPSVYRTVITPPYDKENEKFFLDVVPGDAPPLIYATQSGKPRIAVLGKMPELHRPVTYVAMDNRLSISAPAGSKAVTVFHRDPMRRTPVKVVTHPDAAELIARLGGRGPRDEPSLDLTYGEVVAVLQRLADPANSQFYARDGGRIWGASFVLSAPPRLQDVINAAPAIDPTGLPPLPGAGGTPEARSPEAAATGGPTDPLPGLAPIAPPPPPTGDGAVPKAK